ncbi:hypothetical protein [Azospirillum doebereinerae]
MINHGYVDMRRHSINDALDVIEEEESLFLKMENGDYDDELIRKIEDEMYDDISPCLGFDLGTAGSIYALSAAGHAPVSSCNGGTLGGWHPLPNPWIIFYASTGKMLPVISAAEVSNVGLIHGIEGTIELYSDDIRKLPRFARALIEKMNE